VRDCASKASKYQVVLGLDVAPFGFQFGNRDRLHELDHVGQALAEGLRCRRAVVENEVHDHRGLRPALHRRQ
jgi:hypothetical protein